MPGPVVVILAAGKGTRMRSSMPKLLHEICGRPMIRWPVEVARAAGAARIVVVDAPGRPLAERLDPDVISVVQTQALGTGDALRAAVGEITAGDTVVVLYGDVPLIRPETVSALNAAHEGSGAAATMLTAVLEDPRGYGRVVRDAAGDVVRVVETKAPGDATEAELGIHEVNTGIYAFSGAELAPALDRITNANAQGEYYLPDVLAILRADGHRVAGHQLGDPVEMFNVNDRVQLARAAAEAQRRIQERHMLAGVTLVNPGSTVIGAEVRLDEDVVVESGCTLSGHTAVGRGSRIGPHSTLVDATVGEGSQVIHSHVSETTIANGVSVGPFAYLRPGTLMRDGSKAGTFVEIKNSDVGAGAKVPHLSYIGDAEIGERTNLGAATITANYDGVHKHRTTIGADVHGGVDTTFVAPVRVGDRAWTGAGSVITEDVPADALAIARARQRTLEDYNARRRAVQERD
ncbi:MAG TPA: bifunctional UDP-N-acetylglucosamine diphosphorylase/glucosamine-1-phosphate N-acetyltransferase GlmU [Solirubrobacteraceae bacterium]|nr:bifunctional UDP-N-acetylglucosamine diphosphorylase/glucosamine-1-phosphate N-acetyltransferase GlmU [Solirubrobacteraceae bacterium]